MKTLFFCVTVLLVNTPTQALDIFACEPEWAALSKELAGDKAQIFTATSALQDVHQIEARPSLIAKMRRADLIVCTGAELEIAWLPQLMQQAGNTKLSDKSRQFYASEHVALLDKPTQLDRSAGDVHVAGNPHVHLDPIRVQKIAEQLTLRLAQIDSSNADYYQQRYASFKQSWQTAITKWQRLIPSLQNKKIVVSHDNLRYLAEWTGLTVLARLEPKPGLPPTSAHLASVLKTVQENSVYAIVQAAYEDPKSGNWLAQRTQLPHVIVPYTVGGLTDTDSLIAMMDKTLTLLTQANK
jgi:zinc/manganese transport system substrate-binding protein